jgi:hypothetical protein
MTGSRQGQGNSSLENRASLLARVVRYELPIEDTLALLRAYGWDSNEEVVVLTAADAVQILERYLGGDITARQVEHWAELLEMRVDVGYEERCSAELRRLLFLLANPETNETITPSLAIRLRRHLAGEAA